MNWKKPIHLLQKYLKSFQQAASGLHGKIKRALKLPKFKKEKIGEYRSIGKSLLKKVKESKIDYGSYLSNWQSGNIQQKLASPLIRKFIDKVDVQKNKILYIYSTTVIFCSYLIATLLTTSIDALLPDFPPPPKHTYNLFTESEDKSRYEIITARNLFNKDGIIPDTTAIREDLPAIKTSLPLTLLGVILLEDKVKSVASVLDRSENTVVTVRAKDSINREAEVKEILQGKVLFYNKTTQQIEYIDLPKIAKPNTLRTGKKTAPKSSGIREISKDHLSIKKDEVESVLSNMGEVVKQARCVAATEGGRNVGFRCEQIAPGSIYEKIGIQNKDIVISINGEKLTNPGKALSVLRGLRNEDRIQVTLKRNGKIITKKYDIQ